MNKTIRSSILLTAMLAASAAFAAGGDIVKCVDQSGRVTLTDNQCSAGVATVVVAAESPAEAPVEVVAADADSMPAAPAVRRLATQRIAYTPAAIQHDSWAAAHAKTRMLARDVETLKAARLSMQVLDQASAGKHQRLASN
ncbi:MAG: hypothetical protein JWQ01_2449 [Massilia sp.]|nr:hypothetical protein [Massilia sp.]